MPSALTHIGILDHVRDSLPQREADLLRTHDNYACWGSVGPDFLYFYSRDWTVIGRIGDFVFRIHDATDEIVDLYRTVDQAFARTADYLSGGLYEQIQQLVLGVRATVNTLIADVVQNQVDFFELVRPPFHATYEVSQRSRWWWIDLAHHYRTADFARALWRRSRGNDAARAYVVGYLTHVAADVVGHAYVNLVVGGPYRNHWRRHVFEEKCLDTYLWHRWTRNSVSNSNVYRRLFFSRIGYGNSQLPDPLAGMISGALTDVYGSAGMLSGVPSQRDVQDMYTAFFAWIKGATSIGFLNLPQPPDFDWYDLPQDIRDVLDSIENSRPTVGAPPIGGGSNERTWKAFFRSLIRYCVWLVESAVRIATIPVRVLARLASTPLRYLVWLLLKLVYELYDKFRLTLATAGYVHPEPGHVEQYFAHIVRPDARSLLRQPFPWERYHNRLQTYHLA
jgi:hypothetical protein